VIRIALPVIAVFIGTCTSTYASRGHPVRAISSVQMTGTSRPIADGQHLECQTAFDSRPLSGPSRMTASLIGRVCQPFSSPSCRGLGPPRC